MASIRGLRKSALSLTANYSWCLFILLHLEEGEGGITMECKKAKKVNHLLLYAVGICAYLMYLLKKKKKILFWLMQQTRNVLSLVFSCCTTTCTIGENQYCYYYYCCY